MGTRRSYLNFTKEITQKFTHSIQFIFWVSVSDDVFLYLFGFLRRFWDILKDVTFLQSLKGALLSRLYLNLAIFCHFRLSKDNQNRFAHYIYIIYTGIYLSYF